MTATDELLGELARGLRGPGRVKRRLLADARDGLADAIDCYVSAGLDLGAATRRAAAEFGTPGELMPAYQAELDASGQRVSAAVAVVALPPLGWLIDLAWDSNPRVAGVPPWIVALGLLLAAVTVAFGLSAVAVLWSTGRATNGRVTRYCTGALRLGGLGGLAVLASGLATLAATAPPFLLWPPFLVSALVAAAVFAVGAGVPRVLFG